MEIKVTGCHNFPFKKDDKWCNMVGTFVTDEVFDKTVHPSCPLKQQSITVKLETNE